MDEDAGYFIKLRRAHDQQHSIHEAVLAFIERELDFTTTTELHGNKEWTVLRWGDVPAPDPMWGVHVGEFIHNVRSALDHIIYGLVVRNGQDPGKHTQFPIYSSRSDWIGHIEKRDPSRGPSPVHGVPAGAVAIIEAAQPYHVTSKERARHPLLMLVRLSNIDKHRTLHTATVSADAPEYVGYEPPGFSRVTRLRLARPNTRVKLGAEILRFQRQFIREPPPGTKVYVRIRGVGEVAFGEPGKKPIANSSDLAMIRNAVVAIVVGLTSEFLS